MLPFAFWEITKDRLAGWANNQIDQNVDSAMQSAVRIVEYLASTPLTWTISAGIIVVIILLLHSYWIEIQKARSATDAEPIEGRDGSIAADTELLRAPQSTAEDTDAFVPFKEAVIVAYEETRGTKAATIAEGLNADDVLGYYAHALFDGHTTLYGNFPPSRKFEAIPNEEHGRCGFSADKSALRRHGENRNLYENLQIKRSDLDRRISELKGLSETITREVRVRKIDELYAEAVNLRNNVATYRVLHDASEAKMNALQFQLLEELRVLAPERSINLNTLNQYDANQLPKMLLQDPKRALEFSEFLRRVMKILEDYK